MSIEALPIASTTFNDSPEIVEDRELQSPTDAEVVLSLLHLQSRKETLSTGLTHLAAQINEVSTDRLQLTRVAMTNEYRELTDTIKALKDEYPDVIKASESIEERRVRLHNESMRIIKLLHELQTRHATLTMGMIALAESNRTHTSTPADLHDPSIATDERSELTRAIIELREEQRDITAAITACNQTIWRPNGEKKEEKAERRRIEQPYVNQIYNNGEDPTETEGIPEHLVGVHYRYLTNAPI